MTASPPAFNAKRAGRIFLGRQQQTPAPVAVAEPVVDVVPLTVAERLAKANPAFTLLVETLDLVEVYTRTLPADLPEPLPPLPRVTFVTTPHTEKLRALAAQTYQPNTSYTQDIALQLLATATGRPIDRAGNGLAMMLEEGVLSLTLAKDYYLTDSTPF